jgi:hypothetical protein
MKMEKVALQVESFVIKHDEVVIEEEEEEEEEIEVVRRVR